MTNTTSGNFIQATESATINLQIAFNGANTGASATSGKTLTFAQPQAFGSAFGQYWTGGGTIIFNGNLTGSTGGMFRAENSTTVQVNGATNTFTSTRVGAESNATFACNSATCFGDNANTIYMGGGTVALQVSNTFTNNFQTSLTTVDVSRLTANDNVSITGTNSTVNDDLRIDQLTAGKSLQFTGTATLNGNLEVYGNNTTSDIKFDGGLTGAGGVTVQSGNAWMSAPHTFDGIVTVKSGAVAKADQIDSLGSSLGATVVESGGSLVLESGAGDVTSAEPLQIAGSGVASTAYAGAIYGVGTNDFTLTGTVALTDDATVYSSSIGDNVALNGVISGTADLTLIGQFSGGGSGSVTIGGASPNTYVGDTNITGGTVYFEKTGAITGDLNVESTDPGTNRSHAYFYNSSSVMSDSGILTMGPNDEDGITFGEDGETIGGLVGTSGVVQIQTSGDKVIIDQGFDSTYAGTFYTDGNTGTIEKRGTGALTLTGDYQAINDEITFLATEGTLVVNGTLRTTNGGNVNINGGKLKGTGTVRNVTATSGTLAPGNSPGTLSVSTLTLNSSTTFEQEIAGPVAGTSYDQVISNGAVNLGDATLSVKPSYTPSAGQVFTIITGPSITGTFKDKANNSTFVVDGITFRINYGSTSVTLTYVSGTYDPSGTLANTGTSMLLAVVASLMLVATSTALATRKPRSQATPSE